MTTRNEQTLHFNVSKATGWKDLFVVASLAIVLGAFVAQISSVSQHASAPPSVASATLNAASNG
jgi:hypothetical protein